MYESLTIHLPFTVLQSAVSQLESLEAHGMILADRKLTSYSYDESNDMWVLYFGLISVNVFLS